MIQNNKQFDIIIVGAGIAGLAAAISLILQGHRVKILDGAPELLEIGAGIQVPPNSVRILRQLGVFEELAKKATWPESITMRRWHDGTEIGATPLIPLMEKEYGFPYLLIHRGDLHGVLLSRCRELQADIRTNSLVLEIDQSAPSVTLANGEVLSADLIIGADGIKSRVRKAVITDTEVSIIPDTNCAYRTLIPGSRLLKDPVLKPLIEQPKANCWIGNGGHIMAYPIRNGALYNFVMNYSGVVASDKPFEVVPIEELRQRFKHWDERVMRLINIVPECTKWQIAEADKLATWISKSGKVVLIGDASHAMFPYMSQGAAMAVEDAAAISECIKVAKSAADFPFLMKEYEKIRRDRCYIIRDEAQRHGEAWKLEDGPEQEKRDRLMSLQHANGDHEVENPNKWSDPKFSQWLFGYDAYQVTKRHLASVYKPMSDDEQRVGPLGLNGNHIVGETQHSIPA